MNGTIFLIIGLVIVAILVIWAISAYNSMVRKKNYIREAWSGIDNQLKRKANIIPNLVDTIRMQTKFESDIIDKIAASRAGMLSKDRAEAISASDTVTRMLPSIMALSENYPQLGTNQSYLKLMEDVKDVEDKVAYARTRYNMCVIDFNNTITVFPGSIIAGMFRFAPEKVFEIEEKERNYADNLRISEL
ncbi:LemA family protein [Acetanaerobacterium elongatum]|uniref:LemA protein n=1 Tax=Acetanaerobacterium elongatum TaxID=258515 RepID=A0A1H0DSY7_9FIRM|nr:LemA family protein [Acetanaerobacterium elongatum]SDN73188.1 LemA protein [Acetanaerobacterium elongatum]